MNNARRYTARCACLRDDAPVAATNADHNNACGKPHPDTGSSEPSRRAFFKTAAAFAAAGLAVDWAKPGRAATLQASAGKPADFTVIDTHHHFYAPEYEKAWEAWDHRYGVPDYPSQIAWTPRRSLDVMDAAGVRTAMLSLPSTPGVWFDTGPAEAVRIARTCNEYGAKMVRDYPGRFGLFATLPMIDVQASLAEIAHAFDVLKADGVGLQTNYGNTWPGDPMFKPIFDELNRRRAVVYLHPLVASCCDRLSVGVRPGVIEVPHDTTRAAMSLLISGTLVRCRDIKWLLSHGGGTIPMLAGRIVTQMAPEKNLKTFAPDGIETELKRLYYDTANVAYAPSMAALMAFVPPGHLTFGSDYPYVAIDKQLAALDTVGLSAAQREAIENGNARALLPRLA